jgi:hypothetical protein
MTSAMWFVWLLRGDIRGTAAPSDVIAQRDFIAWWLLWGRDEYPAMFSWTREHADIAVELVAVKNGLFCPRLLARLYYARDDLRDAFPLGDSESLAEYFCWYRINAPRELAAAPSLPTAALAITEEQSERDQCFVEDAWVPRIAIVLSRSPRRAQRRHSRSKHAA